MRPSAEPEGTLDHIEAPRATRRPLAAAGLRVLSDERLARLAAEGDRVAFAVIFDRYQKGLYAYCASLLRNRDDAADALQNTMLRAMGALDGEEREIAVRPWLYRIAHNESMNLLRRPRVEEATEIHASVVADVETSAAVRAQLRNVLDDIRHLPERQRGALVMREMAGLEYDEIAAALKTSPAGAKQAVYDARRALYDLARGREADCRSIQRQISDGDRRTARARPIRAHLRRCTDCRAFQAQIAGRKSSLASFTPALPAAALSHALQGALAGSGVTQATGQAIAVAAVAAALGAGAVGVSELRDGGDPRRPPAVFAQTGPGAAAVEGTTRAGRANAAARGRASGAGRTRAAGRIRDGRSAAGRKGAGSGRLGRADGAPPMQYKVRRSNNAPPRAAEPTSGTSTPVDANSPRRGPIRGLVRPDGRPGGSGPIRGAVGETRDTVNGAVDQVQDALPVATPEPPRVPAVRPPRDEP